MQLWFTKNIRILTKITEDSRLLLVGLVRLTFISYTGPFVTWRRLRSIFEQSEEKTFFFLQFWAQTYLACRTLCMDESLSPVLGFQGDPHEGFYVWFPLQKVRQDCNQQNIWTIPTNHPCHLKTNQWNNIANNKFWNWLSSPSSLQELFIKTLYQTVPALPLQGTNGSHGVELEAQVNESSRLSQEYPWGRSIRVGVQDLCFR